MQLRQSWLLAASLAAAVPMLAQQPTAAQAPQPLDVGAVAPDFTLPGATRFGLLRDPIHLGDFKGKTVVIAFFFKARTRG
jgi:hypothetical protein